MDSSSDIRDLKAFGYCGSVRISSANTQQPAIDMLTDKDRAEKYRAIEGLPAPRARIANLRKLQGVFGSWAEFGRQTGKAASNLMAMAGPNPTKAVGEVIARDLERVLRLEAGWLDR